MTRTPMGVVLRAAVVVAMAAGLSACSVDPATVPGVTVTPEAPCGAAPGARLALGWTAVSEVYYGQFTTDGSGVWVTATGYSYGAIFDPPSGEGSTTVYAGPAESPPRVAEEARRPANATVTAKVFDHWWTFLDLPAGDYWIEAPHHSVEVLSCEVGGLSNGVEAPPYLGRDVTWSRVDPCEGAGVESELGYLDLQSDVWAALSTDGSGVWVMARESLYSTSSKPTGAVYVSADAEPPPYEPGPMAVSEHIVLVSQIGGGGWTLLELPAGDYWITATAVADVVTLNCEVGGPSPTN